MNCKYSVVRLSSASVRGFGPSGSLCGSSAAHRMGELSEMARRDQTTRVLQARREDFCQTSGDRRQTQFRIVRRPFALEQLYSQFPIDAESRLQAQRRSRSFMRGRSWSKKDDRRVAALRGHLQATDLFLACLLYTSPSPRD